MLSVDFKQKLFFWQEVIDDIVENWLILISMKKENTAS